MNRSSGTRGNGPRETLGALTWHGRLQEAQRVNDVVEACCEFVARLSPADVHSLPEGCRPPLRLDADTIGEYALDLVRCERRAGVTAPALLRAMALYFTEASAAIARLARPARAVVVRPDRWP